MGPGKVGLWHLLPVCLPVCAPWPLLPPSSAELDAIAGPAASGNRVTSTGCHLAEDTQMELSPTQRIALHLLPACTTQTDAEALSQPAATSSPTSSCCGLWPVPAHGRGVRWAGFQHCAAGNPGQVSWASLRLRLSVRMMGLRPPPQGC